MNANTIDASLLSRMFTAGARSLEARKEWINELNVFPVPDGDTGTNMTMTIMSAVKEVQALEDITVTKVAKAMSSGSLRGARGNSGVILSQLLRGFYKVVKDCNEIDVDMICAAFIKASETAYKAVMKPKEGTILTVAKGFSDEAVRLLDENPQIEMQPLLEGSLAKAREVLEKTPEMLPVLKEAGVVDSGGQGLVEFLQGAYDLYMGKEPAYEVEEEVKKEVPKGYCAEFLLTPFKRMNDDALVSFEEDLLTVGEDVVILAEDDVVKVHVHSEKPGDIITKAIACGTISMVKVESLAAGHREKVVRQADREKAAAVKAAREAKKAPRKPVGFITVAVGEGLCSIFKDLGADALIEGGQTMNPSTEDVLNAIDAVNADNIFVFPNNKNIILAANQAKKLVEDKKIFVIPTKTIPQGISAMISYNPDMTPEENETEMNEMIRGVKTCQLTYAVRDTHIDDKTIHEGDIMGVGDTGILAVGTDIGATAVDAVGQMTDENSELISIYYGEDVREEEAQELADKLTELNPDCEVELNAGNQPIYYYIISVE